MNPRTLAKLLPNIVATFPSLVLTGPRQSGKTTLLKHLFGKSHSYINLEHAATRARAHEDPINFLNTLKLPVILDEIQAAPGLLPYIQVRIDDDRHTAGQWLLTGSQNFSLMKGVTESLAGRVAVLTLLPFSHAELMGKGTSSQSPSQLLSAPMKHFRLIQPHTIASHILRGNYPELSLNPLVNRDVWCNSYISTYLERDVRNISQLGDLLSFQQFLRSCAIRTGQILDLSGLARDIGVSVPTAKRWLSILVASYQVLLLPPYFLNLGKRLVKRPKLYFADTGLATYLMGIHNEDMLIHNPQYGALFETYIVIDFFKRYYHNGLDPRLYYLRTRDGLEVDLVVEDNQKLYLIEIKSASTITSTHVTSLVRLAREIPNKIAGSILLTNARESFSLSGVLQHPALSFLSR